MLLRGVVAIVCEACLVHGGLLHVLLPVLVFLCGRYVVVVVARCVDAATNTGPRLVAVNHMKA